MVPERNRLTAGNMIRSVVLTLGDVFVPIIPAIVASGLLMGLTEGINNAMGGALAMNPWWILAHTFSNASFVFLQILIGFSAARTFGGNEFLGGVIGMVANHTSLMNAWDIPLAIHRFGQDAFQLVGSRRAAAWLSLIGGSQVSATDASSQAIMGAGGIPQVALVPNLLNVTLQGYQGHVLAIVATVFVMCQLERWLHAHVPDMLDLFVTPLATVLLTSLTMMIVIGPAFSAAEQLTMSFFRFILTIPFGVGTALAGALYSLTVVCGVHHLFCAYEASLCALTPPYNYFNPIVSAACVAHGAAALAVFLKTRSVKRKGLALPAGVAALFGVTEPALYGVSLRYVRPFVAAMAGAAVGGALVSVLDVYATSSGIVGIFGHLIAADSDSYLQVLGASAIVSFATTLLLYQEAEVPEAIVAPTATEDAEEEPREAEEAAETAEPAAADTTDASVATDATVATDESPVAEEPEDDDPTAELPIIANSPAEQAMAAKRPVRPRRRPRSTRKGPRILKKAVPRNAPGRRRGIPRASKRR